MNDEILGNSPADTDRDRAMMDRLKKAAIKEKTASTNPSDEDVTGSKQHALLERLKRQRLILQGRDKRVFEGDFLDIYNDFFILSNVVITGERHIARPAWALVDRKTISHIHPICEVETIEDREEEHP